MYTDEIQRYNSISFVSSSLKSDMEDSLSEDTPCSSCSRRASSVANLRTYSAKIKIFMYKTQLGGYYD